jgi:hypothetical protein
MELIVCLLPQSTLYECVFTVPTINFLFYKSAKYVFA